jgi:multidrug resistance protein, MATE family
MNSVRLAPEPALARAAEPVFRPLAALAAKLSLAMLAPLLLSLYLARLVAAQGELVFSGYSIVSATHTALFIVGSSFLQVLYFLGGRALGAGDALAYRHGMRAGLGHAKLIAWFTAGVCVLAGAVLHVLGYAPELVAVVVWLGPMAALTTMPAFLLVVWRVHASLNGRAGFVTSVAAAGAGVGAVVATAAVGLDSPGPLEAAMRVLATLAAVQWGMLAVVHWGLRGLPLHHAGDAAADPVGRRLRQAGREMWTYGWPIGAVVLMDNALTLSSTLAIGRWWIDALPAHSVVVLWVALGLIVPLGIAQAGVQHVAIAHARGDVASRNRGAVAALVLAAGYGVAAALLMRALAVPAGELLLPPSVGGQAQHALWHSFMPLGGIVLAAEGVIVVAAALMRGMGLTRAPLLQALIGYAVFGTGGQVLCAEVLGLGPTGIWWGLVIGFGVTALVVTLHCLHALGLLSRPHPSPLRKETA